MFKKKPVMEIVIESYSFVAIKDFIEALKKEYADTHTLKIKIIVK